MRHIWSIDKYSNLQKDRPVIYHYFSRTLLFYHLGLYFFLQEPPTPWQWTAHTVARSLAVCQGRLPMFLVVVSFVSWARCPDDDLPTNNLDEQNVGPTVRVFLLENSESFGKFSSWFWQLGIQIASNFSRFRDIFSAFLCPKTSLTHSQFAWKLWISQPSIFGNFPPSFRADGDLGDFGRFGMAKVLKDTKAWQSKWQLAQIRVIVYPLVN